MWVNTTVATCAAMVGWFHREAAHGHATSIGAASGVVAGPSPSPRRVVRSRRWGRSSGLAAGVLLRSAVGRKFRFGYDDSLDVVGVHLVAGPGHRRCRPLSTSTGLLRQGLDQTIIQIVIAPPPRHHRRVTTVIAPPLKATMGWRIPADAETAGIDTAEHAETATTHLRGGW